MDQGNRVAVIDADAPCTRALHALHSRCALIGAGCRLVSAGRRRSARSKKTLAYFASFARDAFDSGLSCVLQLTLSSALFAFSFLSISYFPVDTSL